MLIPAPFYPTTPHDPRLITSLHFIMYLSKHQKYQQYLPYIYAHLFPILPPGKTILLPRNQLRHLLLLDPPSPPDIAVPIPIRLSEPEFRKIQSKIRQYHKRGEKVSSPQDVIL